MKKQMNAIENFSKDFPGKMRDFKEGKNLSAIIVECNNTVLLVVIGRMAYEIPGYIRFLYITGVSSMYCKWQLQLHSFS